MSIKSLFLIIYSGIIILLVCIAIVSLLMLQNQKTLNKSQQIRYESYQAADELRQSSDDLTRLARTYVVTSDKKYEERYWEILDIRNGKKPRPDGRTIPLKKIMENLSFTDEEFGKLKDAENNSNNLVTTETIAMNAVKGLYDNGSGQYVVKKAPDQGMARRIMFDNKYHSDKAMIMGPIGDFFELLDHRTGAAVNEYEAIGDTYLFVTITLIVLLVAGSVGSYLIIYRKIITPLSFASSELKYISEGDLTRRIAIDNKDEIGALAGVLNTMVKCLKDMIRDIFNSVNTLTSSSTELSAISGQISGGAEHAAAKSLTVSTAAEEMSSNMDSVAAAMEEASSNVRMVAAATEEMSSTINEIAQNSEKARVISEDAVSQAKMASTNVDELGIAVKEIGKVTEAITEISEQTNLLALNATIEAARAGEAGKGFAVVATEIKELSRQTSDATRNIKEQIEGIQRTASVSISAIEKISLVITDINDIVSTIASAVEEQSGTTQEIAGNVAHASQGLAEINENVAQSSMVASEITKDVAEVNIQAEEMANNSSQVNVSSEELSKLAEQLNQMVRKFKI